MLLGELLHAEVIKAVLDAEDKWEAIEELVDLLIEGHDLPLSLRQHIIDVVTERERLMTTGMDHGVAFPHGSSEKFDGMIAALGISKAGIDFESIDGQPARILILLVVPKFNFQGQIKTLAGIAHLMQNASFRDAILRAPDVASILQFIKSAEGRM